MDFLKQTEGLAVCINASYAFQAIPACISLHSKKEQVEEAVSVPRSSES